ncbi:hypothetical protein Tco_0548464 [Tanacetum coccineum]
MSRVTTLVTRGTTNDYLQVRDLEAVSVVRGSEAIEIRLSTKRKLGFIRGIIARSLTDANLAELWDMCNNMKTFVLSYSLRKYKLKKDYYAISHSKRGVEHKESQNVLFGSSSFESTALYNKGVVKDKCTIYGFKWHPPKKCWEIVGYPT